ncbi:MAG: hypothetical protein OXD46_00820 [Chloroflexi bacterium]|nr:hypothetical protein [Chloroflexota bacterium]
MQFIHWTFGLPRIRQVAVYVVAPALFALLALVIAIPVSSRTAYADHNSMYVVCPDPILEGNTGKMGIRRSGHKIKRATFFTDNRYHTADSDDYEEYHGVKIESNSSGGDSTLWAPIVTKEDSVPEHDETFAMGFWDGGEWHHCVVEIEDDDAPEITVVDISSKPVNTMFYRAAESIDITVDLDQKVEVDGTPMVSLYIGTGDDSTGGAAKYTSGSGSRSLVFRYRVQPEDRDTDGISVSSASVADDRSPATGFSGNIYAEGTDVPINYSHPGVSGPWNQSVDGRPYVQSARIISLPPDGWEAYRANQVIEVAMTFDTDVVVEGDVSVELYLGSNGHNPEESSRWASYLRGSGTDRLVFGYTVRPGDMDDKGIMVALGIDSHGFGGSGTIKAKGTDVERHPNYLGMGHQPAHKVDTYAPAVTSLGITSRPANGEAYAAGEVISVEATFNEMIQFQGDFHMELDVGGVPRQAAFETILKRGLRSVLVFHYAVQQGDTDSDGVGIGANSLKLNGGGVYDKAGNSAGLSHSTLAADSTQKVDTSSAD